MYCLWSATSPYVTFQPSGFSACVMFDDIMSGPPELYGRMLLHKENIPPLHVKVWGFS